MSRVDFKFTPEQQEKFNLIYSETKKIYPHLVVDEISKERIKVLIAHQVIFGEEKAIEQISVDLDNAHSGREAEIKD